MKRFNCFDERMEKKVQLYNYNYKGNEKSLVKFHSIYSEELNICYINEKKSFSNENKFCKNKNFNNIIILILKKF